MPKEELGGMFGNVALLDIASMHPSSIENMKMFGPFTDRFSEIKQARIAIKHGDFDAARGGLDKFNDVNNGVNDRNKDNKVAKRGALFMINLKHKVQEMGYTVVHIKTDSIKIADADNDVVEFVGDYGRKYGYIFEHEATYDKFCIVNKSTYIAHTVWGDHVGEWTATGLQFQVPYVFKSLFSHEPIVLSDLCETKSATSALYLDFNEGLPEDEHRYSFVGKVSSFCPVKPGTGGGLLMRQSGEDTYAAATGTKGYRWKEASIIRDNGLEDQINRT